MHTSKITYFLYLFLFGGLFYFHPHLEIKIKFPYTTQKISVTDRIAKLQVARIFYDQRVVSAIDTGFSIDNSETRSDQKIKNAYVGNETDSFEESLKNVFSITFKIYKKTTLQSESYKLATAVSNKNNINTPLV